MNGTGTAAPAPEITTVADDEVVVHHGGEVRTYTGLAPDTVHDLDGIEVRTLPRPDGERLATIATVNDVHFGETEAGRLGGTDTGPILRSGPGEAPYPEVMNAAAVAEIHLLDPAAVIAKGDLTDSGRPEEWTRFEEVWGVPFGERLHTVRGNHDAMSGHPFGTRGIPELVALPGAWAAIVDTVIPGTDGGQLDRDQLAWLDEVAARAEAEGLPLLVFGHHHVWNPNSPQRPARYFGIQPGDSEALLEVVARRPAIRGFFAGHTHRNRVRRFPRHTGEVPFVEVACLKDFPGTWAEYRIHEGGIVQVHRRLSSPEALAWSERCRAMFDGAYPWYAMGTLDDRCFLLPGG